MAKIPVGLQLYTVREDMAKDPKATIKAVAQMGYKGVEGGVARGMTPTEWKQLLADNGLKQVGGGVGLGALKTDLPKVVEQCREGGYNTLMFGVAQELKAAGGDWKKVVADMPEPLAKAKAAGLRIIYHNHDFELAGLVDGVPPLDYMYKTIGADVLKAEIDTYWIKTGGQDPVAYIRKYAGRIPYLHIKDRKTDAPAGERRAFTEIGAGCLDWDAIFAEAGKAGVEWYLVEQDQTDTTPLDSARKSIEFLKSRGMA